MVGTLEKNRAMFALIRTPEKDVYQVGRATTWARTSA